MRLLLYSIDTTLWLSIERDTVAIAPIQDTVDTTLGAEDSTEDSEVTGATLPRAGAFEANGATVRVPSLRVRGSSAFESVDFTVALRVIQYKTRY